MPKLAVEEKKASIPTNLQYVAASDITGEAIPLVIGPILTLEVSTELLGSTSTATVPLI